MQNIKNPKADERDRSLKSEELKSNEITITKTRKKLKEEKKQMPNYAHNPNSCSI